jgi:hypothetical protein
MHISTVIKKAFQGISRKYQISPDLQSVGSLIICQSKAYFIEKQYKGVD